MASRWRLIDVPRPYNNLFLSDEEVAARNTKIQEMLDDGASLREIVRSGVATSYWVEKNFQGKGWTHRQGIEQGVLVRTMNRKVKM